MADTIKSMAHNLWEASKDAVVAAAADESLRGDQSTISEVISNILQSGISFPVFLKSVNEELASKDLQVRFPSNTFKRKNWSKNMRGTYEADCELYQISGCGPRMDAIRLSLTFDQKSLLAIALYEYAVSPDPDIDNVLWAFETDFHAAGVQTAEELVLVHYVYECNSRLLASHLSRCISVKCVPAIVQPLIGGCQIKYFTEVTLHETANIARTNYFTFTIDHL